MFIIRPVRSDDLEGLNELAHSAGVGLTTLPRDLRLLRQRIVASAHAFATEPLRPGAESYLFVLEDLRTGQVVGTSGMVAKVGGYEPFYSYEIRAAVHESAALRVRREIPTLHLVSNHSGPSEIGTLFLAPEFRGGGNGRLLSLARFLFIAEFPQRFDRTIIAEMRGVVDSGGHSPFWEALGRHFFDMDFSHADQLSAADKQFIADLMPKHPIYLPMLPQAVQAVIGQVHEETRPALRLLEQEGFSFGGQIDIFDAGPLVSAPREAIRTIRESRLAQVRQIVAGGGQPESHLITNTRLEMRACLGTLVVNEDETVDVPRDVALARGQRLKDRVRYVAAS